MSDNIITLSFNRRERNLQTTKQQLELLMQRVLDEKYRGRIAPYLSDWEHAKLQNPKLQLKDWLQEQLGARKVCRGGDIRTI